MESKNQSKKAICNGISFLITNGKTPNYLHSRYSVGTILEGDLVLKPFEAIYLFSVEKITCEIGQKMTLANLLPALLTDEEIPMLRSYVEIKSDGAKISIEPDHFSVSKKHEKKSEGRQVFPIMENSSINPNWLIKTLNGFVSSVDEDGDITLYQVTEEVIGKENTINTKDCNPISFGEHSLCEPESVPGWVGYNIGQVKILSENETKYFKNKWDKSLSNRTYNFLVNNGMIVKSGFKYGCNFRVYKSSIDLHSEFLILLLEKDLEWFEVSRAVRVANSVKKGMLFATEFENKLVFVKVKRVRSLF